MKMENYFPTRLDYLYESQADYACHPTWSEGHWMTKGR